jgi:hypothetical protein
MKRIKKDLKKHGIELPLKAIPTPRCCSDKTQLREMSKFCIEVPEKLVL